MHRMTTYVKFLLLCSLAGFTMIFLSGLHEIHGPSPDLYRKGALEFGIPNAEHREFVRWLLGKDDEDTHSSHQHGRLVISKTVYPITSGEYIINNPNLCRMDKVSIVVMVHTSPDHFWIRSEMRRTWLNATNYSPESIVTVFLLGTVKDPILQQKIVNESQIHKDIVQGPFLDSYRNLTHKGVMGYRWITEHCRNAQLMVKVDDDSMINFFKLFEQHKQWMVKLKKHIFCNKINPGTMPIIRKNTSKWFVDWDEYKDFKFFPHTYCSGFVVFISMDLVPMLYQAAIGSPFFWVDDFFLFGLLPSKVKNVTFTNYGGNLTFSFPVANSCYTKKGDRCKFLVMPAKKKEIDTMWKGITRNRTRSKYGYYYMHLDGRYNHPNKFSASSL